MLQRAASNAYSWWWASHIRTTQSKWLDANLQDVENRVKVMLKLLGEEADSFGKRAEMYYRRRPEVINHVEDVYRAYRALVERYDHLSKELHKANHTIATACPDEVQYAMLEEEDEDFPRAIMPINSRKIQKSTVEDILKRKREGTPGRLRGVNEWSAPQMSKEKAEEEIGRLQKAILVMQTEKEFVKSSYESGIAKYWEIEKQIADMQEEICHMQDEFDAHAAIEDDEARALMTITALRSCQGTVAELVKKFEELTRSAKMESEKIMSFREKLYAMSRIIDPKEDVGSPNMTVNNRIYPITQDILELQTVYDKIEDFFENNSESSVEEMAYKVDELVDKIINLELKFPKQSAQIKQLKEENENIKNKLDDLQDEMALLDDPSDSSEQLKVVQDALNRSRVLEGSIIEEEILVSTAFSEIFNCIINISKAFGPVGPEDLPGLSAAAGDSAACSEDPCVENVTKESTKMSGGEIRDIEVPTTVDHLGSHIPRKDDDSEVVDRNSSGGNDGVYDSNNGAEEKVPMGNCLMQEEFGGKKSIQAGNHIDLPVSADKNGLETTWESKTDSSLEEVNQGSSGGTNKNGDMGNDGFENFAKGQILGEYSPTAASQTHLLPSESLNTLNNTVDSNEEASSVGVAESSFGGDNRTLDLKVDGDENVPGNSLIQEEGFRVGNGELPKPSEDIGVGCSTNFYSFSEEGTTGKNSLPEADHSCSSDADKNLDSWHAGESKSGEELPKQGGQIAPENIEGLNKHGKVESYEGVQSSFGHTKAYPLEAGDETSLCVPARDSEETGGMYLLVSKVPTGSEDMASHISDSQIEKKNPNVEVFAREKSIFSNHGSRSEHAKSTFVSEDVPGEQEFLDRLEGRDTILLTDYTLVLQSYKETKRRLAELEKKNQEHLEDTKAVIRQLRNANSMKYVEIQSLKGLLDYSEMPPSKLGTYRSNKTLDRVISVVKETDSSDTGAPEETSPFEMKFRTEIDGLVEENLQFLARYSMACHQMQEFSRKYQELQHEMENPENEKIGGEPDAAIEPEPEEKKLRELRTEVDVWFEQNALLDRDLQLKTASLCSLQEEIAEALRSSTEADGARFTPYEAARFQGEVQNMQQSNKKIGNEMKAALERMRELEVKVNETLRKLRESFDLSSRRSSRLEADTSYQNQFKHFPSRRRVPLRNFLFGTKPKKKSLFACINPTYQRQFSDF